MADFHTREERHNQSSWTFGKKDAAKMVDFQITKEKHNQRWRTFNEANKGKTQPKWRTFTHEKKDATKDGGLSTKTKSQQWRTWQPKTKPEMYLRCALTRKKDAANMADFRPSRTRYLLDILKTKSYLPETYLIDNYLVTYCHLLKISFLNI